VHWQAHLSTSPPSSSNFRRIVLSRSGSPWGIAAGIQEGLLVDAKIGNGLGRMIQSNAGLETELLCHFGHAHMRHAVAEDVTCPANGPRLGIDAERHIEEPDRNCRAAGTSAGARPSDRPSVAIDRQMVHGRQRHRNRGLHRSGMSCAST